MMATVDGRTAERARVHAALADPVRLGIVDELALSDRSPSELVARFSVRSNLLAHHLDVLEEAGVVQRVPSRGDRRRRYVRLVPDALAASVTTPLLRAAGVVFVCTRNSARSQLAAACWAAASAVPVSSAGTDPADRVHPEALRAARRRGLDISGAVPARLDPGDLDDKLVVTVCDLAHEELDADLGAARAVRSPVLHWSIPDPAESGRPADFDRAAAVIAGRVGALVPSVVAP
jgi:ArsR family transcriptional regulator, arsenate/arsenite/antimonite-responsive transcriptional repressor / arsenate reductase (thioredoxin)